MGKGLHANLAEGPLGRHWLEHGGLEVDLDLDHDRLSDLSDTAQKAADEQAKLLQRVMQRTYVTRKDLQQFLGESAEMGTLAQAIAAEVRKDAPSILRAHEAAGRVYMRAAPDGFVTQGPGFRAAEWTEENGKKICRFVMPEAPSRYAWSQARRGVSDSFPVDALEPWYELREGNPLIEYALVRNISTGAMNVPNISTGEVTKNGNVPDSPAAPVGVTVAGQMTAVDVYDLTSSVPLGPSRWVVALEGQLMSEHMLRHGFAQGADALAAVKAGVRAANFGAVKVTTGVAAALPTAATLPGKLASMLANVKGYYRLNAAWMANESIEAVLFSLFSAAGYAVPLQFGIRELLGYPWRLNSHADNGKTADDVSCYFGGWMHALTMGMETEFLFRLFEETNPGALTFHSHSACGYQSTNTKDTISYLETEA